MASSSGLCSSFQPPKPKLSFLIEKDPISYRNHTKLFAKSATPHIPPPLSVQSVAREVPADLSSSSPSSNNFPTMQKKVLEKGPRALWGRYVDWLYQHKELGLYLDVSRIGFADQFVMEMEPRFLDALKSMEKLEKGAIANPDEQRMVGHYWLRNSKLAPNSFLTSQIENTLLAVSKFADDVISGKSIGFLLRDLEREEKEFILRRIMRDTDGTWAETAGRKIR